MLARGNRSAFLAIYTAKVRITVQADGVAIIREGHGTGEGKGATPGEVHDTALKVAETDATKRALATFGRPFGLELYNARQPKKAPSPPLAPVATLPSENQTLEAQGGPYIAPTEPLTRDIPASAKIDKSVLTFGGPSASAIRPTSGLLAPSLVSSAAGSPQMLTIFVSRNRAHLVGK